MYNSETIIKYIDGELDSKENLEFENNLKSDKDFKIYFNAAIEVDFYLKDKDSQLLRNTIKKVHKKFNKVNLKKDVNNVRKLFPSIKNIYKIAGILIFLIGLTYSLTKVISKKIKSSKNLFSKYYEPYQKNISNRYAGIHMTNIHMAFQAYKNRQYKTAIDYFDKVLSMDSTVLFYKGVASIECGDYITALNSFIQLTGDSTNQYYIQSHWYMALTWLKLNQPENAKRHLKWLI